MKSDKINDDETTLGIKYALAFREVTGDVEEYIDGSITGEFANWLIKELEAWQKMYYEDTDSTGKPYNFNDAYKPLVGK